MNTFCGLNRLMTCYFIALTMIMTSVSIPLAQAQDTVVEEVITVGTRVAEGRSAAEFAVPVDRLTDEAIQAVGNSETARALQSLAPSFNFPSSTVSDGTDALRPATLRGLGPDQVLVLVNGKRRHSSALLHVNGSVGRGTAGVDMNAIPVSAISRIEVLRDGASAQYGSDAISGVINIVLNDRTDGGEVGVYYGGYRPDDGDHDGEVQNYWASYGTEIGALKVTADFNWRDRGRTNRAGTDGTRFFALQSDGSFDEREYTVNRNQFRVGDAASEHLAFAVNASLEINDSMEAYGFFTHSERENTSGGFYRRPVDTGRNPPIRANGDAWDEDGFLPVIDTEITDIGVSGGIRMELVDDWHADFSVTYSSNEYNFGVSNSVNASWVNSRDSIETALTAPRSTDAGTLDFELLAFNADFSKVYNWGHLAVGAEVRDETFELHAGDEYSWQDYDGACVAASNCLSSVDASGGIQVFPGYRPTNEVNEERSIWAVYADAEYTEIENWLFGAALRYEDYDDFGDTLNFKLTARWQLLDNLALRGAISTGFRAPSMQQQFTNNVATQFITPPGGGDDVAVEIGLFRNDSALARAVGIPELKEEESENFSFGVIYDFSDELTLTVDLYRIDIDDRIRLSGNLGRSDTCMATTGPLATASADCNSLDAALIGAGAGSGRFMVNAADTETQGIDLIINWEPEALANGALLKYTLALNHTNTKITDILVPSLLAESGVSGNDLFTERDQSILEDWQPRDRINFTVSYDHGPITGNLAFNHYGEYTVTENDGSFQTYGDKMLVDLRVSYDFGNGVKVSVGGQNITDETPDSNRAGFSTSRTSPDGGLVDTDGTLVVNSPNGVFPLSRRSAPFGFNGAFFYAEVRYSF